MLLKNVGLCKTLMQRQRSRHRLGWIGAGIYLQWRRK